MAASTRTVDAPATPRGRVLKFIEAFHHAPNDADIEVRCGKDAAGAPAVLVSISNGGGDHALMVPEARKVAVIMEDAMNAHPSDPEGATLPNIIMALRTACDKAETQLRR